MLFCNEYFKKVDIDYVVFCKKFFRECCDVDDIFIFGMLDVIGFLI